MQIAICDDNAQELAIVAKLLDRYREECREAIDYKSFSSGTALLDSVSRDIFDLMLLDIIMPGVSGLSAAKEIRTTNKTVKIVFLTSSPEFAVESYRVSAMDYLIKPITAETLFPVLDSLFHKAREQEPILKIKTEGSRFALPLSQIVYLEVMNRRVRFYLADGNVQEVFGYLSDYEEELLSKANFVKPHRSYIVNLKHVREVSIKGVSTDIGQVLPISRNSFSQTRLEFAKSLFDVPEVE